MSPCRRWWTQARELGAVVASDECYAELGWGAWDVQRGGEPVPSILDPRVAGGSHEGLLAVYSLSKQSNVAGYRAAFVAGDPDIMANLVNSRKHAGMIVPYPVQEAMRVALGDDAHVLAQKDLYRGRRERLVPALQQFGLEIKESEAGLYLWSTAGESTWDTVAPPRGPGHRGGPGRFLRRGRQRVRARSADRHRRTDRRRGGAARRSRRNNGVTRATKTAFYGAFRTPPISDTRQSGGTF